MHFFWWHGSSFILGTKKVSTIVSTKVVLTSRTLTFHWYIWFSYVGLSTTWRFDQTGRILCWPLDDLTKRDRFVVCNNNDDMPTGRQIDSAELLRLTWLVSFVQNSLLPYCNTHPLCPVTSNKHTTTYLRTVNYLSTVPSSNENGTFFKKNQKPVKVKVQTSYSS